MDPMVYNIIEFLYNYNTHDKVKMG
jgi:hypothetical protein